MRLAERSGLPPDPAGLDNTQPSQKVRQQRTSVMLLSMAERRLGVAQRLARCIPDRRDPSRIAHTIADLDEDQGGADRESERAKHSDFQRKR